MKRILYVEDNKETALGVQVILKEAGFNVDLADTGSDCIRKVAKQEYNLVLIDIMLPDMSGWDVLDQLRKRKGKEKYAFLSAIPISEERRKELVQSGVLAYITKPFENKDLVQKVKKMLK